MRSYEWGPNLVGLVDLQEEEVIFPPTLLLPHPRTDPRKGHVRISGRGSRK